MTAVKNNLDIKTVDKDTLVSADDVRVDLNAPKSERMASTLKQMNGNPYFFRSGTIAVMVSYTDTSVTLDERMESYLRTV